MVAIENSILNTFYLVTKNTSFDIQIKEFRLVVYKLKFAKEEKILLRKVAKSAAAASVGIGGIEVPASLKT